MSHFVAQSIKIKPNGDIFCIGDDNNVYPRYNSEVKFNGTLRDLFDDLMNGNIQPVDSANDYKWRFAVIKSRESDNMDERYQLFLDALKTKNKQQYRLVRKTGGCPEYFHSRGQYFFATKEVSKATIFNLYKATHVASRYGVEIDPIHERVSN